MDSLYHQHFAHTHFNTHTHTPFFVSVIVCQSIYLSCQILNISILLSITGISSWISTFYAEKKRKSMPWKYVSITKCCPKMILFQQQPFKKCLITLKPGSRYTIFIFFVFHYSHHVRLDLCCHECLLLLAGEADNIISLTLANNNLCSQMFLERRVTKLSIMATEGKSRQEENK